MVSNLPNFAAIFGYTNASWTLKADLTASYVARLLNHMKKKGYHTVCPEVDTETVQKAPLIGLKSGYVARAVDAMPKQGDEIPWRNRENYVLDSLAIRCGKFEDGVLQFR